MCEWGLGTLNGEQSSTSSCLCSLSPSFPPSMPCLLTSHLYLHSFFTMSSPLGTLPITRNIWGLLIRGSTTFRWCPIATGLWDEVDRPLFSVLAGPWSGLWPLLISWCAKSYSQNPFQKEYQPATAGIWAWKKKQLLLSLKELERRHLYGQWDNFCFLSWQSENWNKTQKEEW